MVEVQAVLRLQGQHVKYPMLAMPQLMLLHRIGACAGIGRPTAAAEAEAIHKVVTTADCICSEHRRAGPVRTAWPSTAGRPAE